jgi:hypothetical protein
MTNASFDTRRPLNPGQHRTLQRPRPYHKIDGDIKEQLHHRNWDGKDEEARINDIRLQLIMTEGRLCCYEATANVGPETRSLACYLWSAISYSKTIFLRKSERERLEDDLDKWTNKLPRKRDVAIESIERLIAVCDSMLLKLRQRQGNEFLRLMNITREEAKPKGAELFYQIFAPEVEERAAAEARVMTNILHRI